MRVFLLTHLVHTFCHICRYNVGQCHYSQFCVKWTWYIVTYELSVQHCGKQQCEKFAHATNCNVSVCAYLDLPLGPHSFDACSVLNLFHAMTEIVLHLNFRIVFVDSFLSFGCTSCGSLVGPLPPLFLFFLWLLLLPCRWPCFPPPLFT